VVLAGCRLLPQPVIDDRAEEEAERIAADARQAVVETVEKARAEVGSRQPAKTTDRAKTAKPKDTGKPAAFSEAAAEAGAPGAVTDQVEQIAEQLDLDEPTDRAELPIPDFDNVSLGSLRGRLRSLSLEQLVVLREWEQAHAKRLPVITLLDNRIAKVSAEQDDKSGDAYPAGTGSSGKETVRPGS
jgi:hypothetical protein